MIVAAFGTLNPSRRALHNLLERDTRGIALHITSRVARLGGTDDILVVRTIKDIVAGSGIKFEDFGTHVLKGVPDDWQLYRVADLAYSACAPIPPAAPRPMSQMNEY